MYEDLNIFLVDNSFNIIEKRKTQKPQKYEFLMNKIRNLFKKLPDDFILFYLSQNFEENIITNSKDYELTKNIIFIRKNKEEDLDESLFHTNYNELLEEEQEILDEKYSCSICNNDIKNENPYFCYECQKIFHIECLKTWDKKRKNLKEKLNCMSCRKELPLEEWKQKLDYIESRKKEAENMNKINELTKKNNIKDILIKISEEIINELKEEIKEQNNLIKKFRIFKEKIFIIIEWISRKMNEINSSNNHLTDEKLLAFINYYGEEKKIFCPKNFSQFIIKLCYMLRITIEKINNFKIYYNKDGKEKIIKNKESYNLFLKQIMNKNNNQLYIKLLDGNNIINDFVINDKKIIDLITSLKEPTSFFFIPLNEKLENIFEQIENLQQNNEKKQPIKGKNNLKLNIYQNNSMLSRNKSFYNILTHNRLTTINNNFNNSKKFIGIKKYNNKNLNRINIEYRNEINLIYFTEIEGIENIFGEKFVENNEENIELIVNGEEKGLVKEYKLKKGENKIKIIIKNKIKNLEYIFYDCKSLKNIEELKYLDTSEITNFSYSFTNCSLISNIKPLQLWDISKAINIKGIFYGCSLISDLTPLKNWNVSNINNFSYIFYGCNSLSNIDSLGDWDVSNGTDFSDMFRSCTSLSNIKSLKKWKVSKCVNFQNMFFECISLKNIEFLKNWDVSNCTNFKYMFCNCSSLVDIKPLENWNVSNGKNFEGIFSRCTLLSDIKPLTKWKVSKSVNFSFIFNMCINLSNIEPLKNWDVSNGNDFQSLFSECYSLTNITPLENWNVSNGNIFKRLFYDCSSLSDITPLQKWDTSKGTNFENMFSECTSLIDLKPIENWNISNGKNFYKMFWINSTNIIDKNSLKKWNLPKDKYDSMFYQDKNI